MGRIARIRRYGSALWSVREQKLIMSASSNAQSAVYSTSKIERERIKSVRITCGASALLSFAGNRPSKGNFKQRSGPGGVSIEYIVVRFGTVSLTMTTSGITRDTGLGDIELQQAIPLAGGQLRSECLVSPCRDCFT
jgi:hypothetical protein